MNPFVMEAEQTTVSVPPTPAIVLTLGHLGVEVVTDVQSFFLANDERRAAVTRFLAPVETPQAGWTLAPVAETTPAVQALPPSGRGPSGRGRGSARGEADETRRQVCERFVAGAGSIRRALASTLRELRTSEPLMAAGLSDVAAPQLEVILVADLTDAWAGGVLFPLAILVQDLLTQDPYAGGHLLLSTALFERADQPMQSAQLYAALQDLETLLDPKRCMAGQGMATALGLEAATPLNFQVYLFDQRKEGMREVRDRAELRVVLGNSLLALLSGGLAHRLSQTFSTVEKQERRAYYSSMGAAALVFDPAALVEACAARQGADFIAEQMLPAEIPDLPVADETAADLAERLGDERAWFTRLCADTPCELWDDGSTLHLGLHFADLHLNTENRRAWGRILAGYAAHFEQNQLPRYRDVIQANATALAEALLARQARAIDALPQSVRLYPGGLHKARRALDLLDRDLAARMDALGRETPAVPAWRIDALAEAAQAFPRLPIFVALLVLACGVEAVALVGLGGWLQPWLPVLAWLKWVLAALAVVGTAAGALWRLHRLDHELVALRDDCVRGLERRGAVLLERTVREGLIGLCCRLRAQIEDARRDLHYLEGTLAEVQACFAHRQRCLAENASFFRQSAADDEFAAWAYAQWRQVPEALLDPLLVDRNLLANWRSVTAEDLAGRLLAYGRQVFAPVHQLTLHDVLRRRQDADALWTTLTRQTTPLLRPNFDRLGGGGYAHTAGFVLVADAEAHSAVPAMGNRSEAWETIWTSDPHVAICCQVRHLIPLAALRTLVYPLCKDYEALAVEEREEIRLFD